MGEAMVLEEGEVEGVLLPPPERLEPVEAGADLLERPPLARLLLARLGTARLGTERLLAARLGAWRLPERTGELLLTAVATTGMVAPGLGRGAGTGALGTDVGTTVAAVTTGAGATEAAAGLPGTTRGLEAPGEAAAAAATAFAAESAGVLVPLGLGSGGVEEAMAGENRTRKGKLGAGP